MSQSYVRFHTEEPPGMELSLRPDVTISVISTGRADGTVEAVLLDGQRGVYGGVCWTGLSAYDLLYLFVTVNCASGLQDAAERLSRVEHLKQFAQNWEG